MIEKRNKTQIIEEMKTHIENAYKLSLKPIVSFTNFKEFWELNTELGYNVGLFLLNKYFFQSLLGFYTNINNQLMIVALSSLRMSLEISRLFRACLIDDVFRGKYLHNTIRDIHDNINYSFKQGKVLKVLNKSKCRHLEKDEQYRIKIIDGNNQLSKGSALSDYHTLMSVICHALNINTELHTAFKVAGDIDKRRINISILDKNIEEIDEDFISNNVNASVHILSLYLDLFYGEQEIQQINDELLKMRIN